MISFLSSAIEVGKQVKWMLSLHELHFNCFTVYKSFSHFLHCFLAGLPLAAFLPLVARILRWPLTFLMSIDVFNLVTTLEMICWAKYSPTVRLPRCSNLLDTTHYLAKGLNFFHTVVVRQLGLRRTLYGLSKK